MALPKSGPLHPAVTAFFNNDDGFIHEVVIPSMERTRKSKVYVKIVASDGTLLQRCRVSAELQKHEFLFGHCNLATEKSARNRHLLNTLFHFTCPENLTKWKSYAPKPGVCDFSKIDSMVAYCNANGISIEWHFLTGYHPEWFTSVQSDSEKASCQLENCRTVLNRYQGTVNFFQVFNEDWHTHIQRAKVFCDQTELFKTLRKEFSEVELGVCDCWSFNKENRLPAVEDVKSRYPGINFVSMHAHKPRRLWASPKEMFDTFEQYKGSGVKVHVTEFGIIEGGIEGNYRSGDWDGATLAEYFVQVAVTAFSHPSVRVLNLWANYDKFTGNRLFGEDGKPTEQYDALNSLLNHKLITRVAGHTDQNGECVFNGFQGRYKFSVKSEAGQLFVAEFDAGRGATHCKIMINKSDGTAYTTTD
ncbi:MAG: endo-1,4-beta-xylanase [Pirellulales bacterium]|nr:endo-1,4-beta-xylanase [Pirellulales bacterium]